MTRLPVALAIASLAAAAAAARISLVSNTLARADAPPAPDASTLVILNPEGLAAAAAAPAPAAAAPCSVSYTARNAEVADALCGALGVPPAAAPRPELSDVFGRDHSVFRRPRAAQLFVVQGLAAADLADHGAAALAGLTASAATRNVVALTDKGSVSARLASFMTGTEPAVHGIVGEAFPTRSHHTASAYLSPDGQPLVGSYVDELMAGFGGEALAVSMSACPGLANATNVHPDVRARHPEWNHYSAALDGRVFRQTRGLGSRLGDGLDARLAAKADPDAAAKTLLELELDHAERMLAELAHHDLVADDVPDSFAFAFFGLAAARRQSTHAFAVALAMLDARLPPLIARAAALYDDQRVLSMLYLLPEAAPVPDDVAAAAKAAASGRLRRPDDFLPNLFVKRNMDPATVAEGINDEILGLGWRAVVHPDEDVDPAVGAHAPGRKLLERRRPTAAMQNGLVPTYDEMVSFQIMFWMSILLAFTVLMVSCWMCQMDVKHDSLLYRVGSSGGSGGGMQIM